MAAPLRLLGWIGKLSSAPFATEMRRYGVDRPMTLADAAAIATKMVCAMRAVEWTNNLQQINHLQDRCGLDCWPRKPEFGGAPSPR